MSREVPTLELGYLTCDHRAGTAKVHTPAAGTLDPEFDGGDPIGDEEEQAKAE